MSVTILSQPDTHTPGYNSQYFVATSTQSNQTNFKYVVSVTIGPDTITEKINKRPDNSLLYFDPSRIVQSYLENTFSRTALDFEAVADSIIYVTVGVTEEYGDPVSGFAGASGSYYAWNAAYNTHDFSSYSYSTTALSKDLTLAPSLTDEINFNQQFLYKTWHKAFGTKKLRYLSITAFDSSGTTIQDSVIENAFYNVTDYTQNIIRLNCSPYGLNNFTGTVVSKSDPAQDIIPSSTTQYTYYFYEVLPVIGNIASNVYTVNIDTMCYKYDRYVLHFLNRLDNPDSFTFELLNRSTAEKKIAEYKRNPYENVSNTLTYYNDKADSFTYSTTITNKMVLNSDWITDAQSLWLKDMIMSPTVILEDSTGALFAVKITDTSWESKLKVNDRIFNATINIEFKYQDIRQRG